MDNKNGTNHVLSSFQDFKINRSQQELQTEVLVDKPPINKVKQKQTMELGQIWLFCMWSPTSFQTSKTKQEVLSDFSLAVTSKSNQLPVVGYTSSISGWHTRSYVYILLSWYRRPSFHLKYLKILLSIPLDFISFLYTYQPSSNPFFKATK